MIQDWLSSFVDELSKLAEKDDLTPSARAKEYLQYGALGGTMGPVVGGAANLIQRGELSPLGVKFRRWLPAQMMTGAIYGAAIPVLRGLIHKKNVEGVAQEQQAGKLLRSMAPEGTEAALKKLQPKTPLVEL